MIYEKDDLMKDRMVAYCDICGFKDYFDAKGIEKTLDEFNSLIINALAKVLDFFHNTSQIPKNKSIQNPLVGSAWFSDSIILYSKQDNMDSYYSVIYAACLFLERTRSKTGFKIKCGIDYGQMAVDENRGYYIGKALIEAYLLEENLDFFGGALTINAKEKVDEIVDPSKFNYLKSYNIPLINGEFIETYALRVGPFNDVCNYHKQIPPDAKKELIIRYFNSFEFQRDVFKE